MYGRFTYMWSIYMVNLDKYKHTTRGSYGINVIKLPEVGVWTVLTIFTEHVEKFPFETGQSLPPPPACRLACRWSTCRWCRGVRGARSIAIGTGSGATSGASMAGRIKLYKVGRWWLPAHLVWIRGKYSQMHSLKLTAKAPENRPGPKRKPVFRPFIFRCYVGMFNHLLIAQYSGTIIYHSQKLIESPGKLKQRVICLMTPSATLYLSRDKSFSVWHTYAFQFDNVWYK